MFLDAENVSKSYRTGEVTTVALKNASLRLDKGEIGVILGPSGSGKSTLMNIIGGIDRADSGKVTVAGLDVTAMTDDELTEYRRERVGFVFQSYNLIPHLTTGENIEIIQNISKTPLSMDEVLASMDLADKKNRFPRELSGGEQQRVAIARAIVKNPQLLLCDEITGALDFVSAIEVLSLVQGINRRFGTTALLITHNAAIASIANRVYKFRSGEVTDADVNRDVADARTVVW
jgi:putative ABC transport system ATP-binding protein